MSDVRYQTRHGARTHRQRDCPTLQQASNHVYRIHVNRTDRPECETCKYADVPSTGPRRHGVSR